MNDLQQILATVLGVAMILVGLGLVVFRKDTAASHVKIMNVEVNLSTPALVVLVAGCALFALPIFVPHKSASWSWPAGGSATPAKPATPGVEITQEEKEPNDSRGQANLLPFGAAAAGVIDKGESDYFRVDIPKGRTERNRLVVRRSSPDGALYVSVFDEAEQQIYHTFLTQLTGSTLLPKASHYLIRLDGWNRSQGYEVVIRGEEPATAR